MSGQARRSSSLQFWVVVAPTGEHCRWTAAVTPEGAARNLLGGHFPGLWDFAVTQGYALVFQNGTSGNH